MNIVGKNSSINVVCAAASQNAVSFACASRFFEGAYYFYFSNEG